MQNKTSSSSRKIINNVASYRVFLSKWAKNFLSWIWGNQNFWVRLSLGHYLTFCFHQKKHKMGWIFAPIGCAEPGKTVIVINFVRHSAGQQINNTMMTQERLFDKAAGGIQDLSLGTLVRKSLERVKSGLKKGHRPRSRLHLW